MSRGLKIGLAAVAGLVVIVVVIVFVVLSSLDSIIKEAVETYGSEATQAKVRLNDVEISPTSGEGALRGLFVGNPKGFETDSAFELGSISVRLDIGTVTEDTIVIKEILIDKPAVTYEIGSGGSNIDALKRNVNAYAGGEKKEAAAKPAEGGEGPKLIIEKLRITGGVVNVSAAMLQGKKLSAPLPTIELTDIGKDKGGAGPGEAIEQVLNAVSQSVSKSVATLNLDKLMGGVKGAAEEAIKGAGGAAEGAKGAIEKGAGGVGDTLKGLLPKSN